MRPVALLLLVWLFCVPTPLFAQSAEPAHATSVENAPIDRSNTGWFTTDFDLSAGYRRDQLNWDIAGNLQGSNPNVRSELSWSGVKIYQLKLANRTVIRDRIYMRGHLSYGMVASGDNRDSDYNGDNRTLEFSRSLNGVDGNNVWDGSLGVGPRFVFYGSDIALCPMIGYAVSEQDLNIVDGYQSISPGVPPVGPIAGLDSRYETQWKGPWVGLDLRLSIPCAEGPFNHIDVTFTGQYHWVDYTADANWNLRTDYQHPVSFAHSAEGNGFMAGVAILFTTQNRWGLNVGMNITEMTTDPGLDRIYFADGTTADTRLNEVQWRSITFEAGLSYAF